MNVYEIKKIICHGCKKRVNVMITNSRYLNKKIGGTTNNPVCPAFATAKIANHRRGLLKGRCNRSGKVFKITGKFFEEDRADDSYFIWNLK